MAKTVNSEQFKEEIKNGVTLVDFFATWCGPCKMLGPVLEEIASDLQGKVNVIKVDIDQSPELADQFRISSVPTMILFKDGNRSETMVGFSPKASIMEVLEGYL